MADYAKEFLKHVVEPQKPKKGKKGSSRAALSVVVSYSRSAAASSGSPAGDKVTSPLLCTSSARGSKRQRGHDEIIDVDVEVGLMLPLCHEMTSFLDAYPLKV
jgi:hypothetical protein